MSTTEQLPTLDQWDTFLVHECEHVALALLQYLPSSFRYVNVEKHAQGGKSHWIAFFEWRSPLQKQEPLLFAFLPGEKVTLGYDRTHSFRPTAEQLESWQLTVKQGWLSCTLEEYLDAVMSPLREVALAPFLLQVKSTNPMVPEILDDGRIMRHDFIRFDDVRRIVTTEGFRLPHADEWEYACSAGARTLFRWGDDTPSEHIPIPEDDEEFEWKEHLQPNAFGLFIAMNPYHQELCDGPGVMTRGGDGGGALHRGVGTFTEWLTLASPFVGEIQKVFLDKGGIYGLHFRRLYSLKDILIDLS